MATFDEIKSVLYGTETSNRPGKIFTTSLAVPRDILGKQFGSRSDDILGTKHGANFSGLTFGSNQLDIANNDIARRAYERIVNNAFDTGAISQEQKDRLIGYS